MEAKAQNAAQDWQAAGYRFDPQLLLGRHDEDWLEKTQPYAEKVIEVLGATQGRVLDVGGGKGGLDVCMAIISDLEFVVSDISERQIEYAAASMVEHRLTDRIETLVADSQELPFEDGSFDYVITTASISGWHNQQRGVEEMYRVLKPGGRIFIRGFGTPFHCYWKLLKDACIPEFNMVCGKDMTYICIYK